MRTLGNWMQKAALAVLPLAMLLQLLERLTLGQMLTAAVFGAALFWLGRLLEGHAGAG